jgi:hypothetical protein
MKLVYTVLVSCIVLSALAAAEEECVACTLQPNIIEGGIQKRCKRAKGTPYQCNFAGYQCKFCKLSGKDAITKDMKDWCKSHSRYNSDGTVKDRFDIDVWSLTKCAK